MPNSSLLAIPAMWATIMIPHAYAVSIASAANNGRFDNANAKGHAFQDAIRKRASADALAKYERCEAAERNGFENLPLFAAAVLAANYAGVDQGTISSSAWTYVALRIVYNFCYISIKSHKTSYIRSLVWGSSILIVVRLFFKAAAI